MFSKLILHNYRSHKDTKIEFAPLMAIIGPNGHGKTNIFRALLTVLSQKDFTEEDIMYGETEASIRLEFTDGRIITRWRKGKNQTIVLEFPDGKVEEYFTVNDNKERVEAFTKVGPVRMEGNTTEFLQVFESDEPQNGLLKGYSPSTILQRVNRLMIGNKLESVKKKIDSDNKTVSTKIDLLKKELEGITNKLVIVTSASRESNIEYKIKQFTSLNEKHNEIIDKIVKLTSLQEKIQKLSMLLNDANYIYALAGEIEDKINALKNASESKKSAGIFYNVFKAIKDLNQDVCGLNEEKIEWEKKVEKAKETVCPKCNRPL